MAKEVTGTLKLQIPAGQANPSPPVGPALGQAGLNIMEFCKDFNARTQAQAGDVLPVVITVYKDKSFSFVCKQPPASALLKKSCENSIRIWSSTQRKSRNYNQESSNGYC